ncbi:MAG: hypothetical protein OWR52_10775 [Acidibacillus sp.]|uniref:Transaldolase n=1 Tax=Sulfoacidibacillus ferrooxidans TaxID=2005001 RepID=A0A9X1V7Z3_9BACL|nr:hypothetical protein [Sulfoacidibacillus ferrooxidans]MCI0183346.1 Transaldolase [Sulfoacidibacillus ferrooxidans]MCY0893976.1 hypothetical protein [Acidibacillus sp.]
MRFYLETAHYSEAQRAAALGFVAGVYIPRKVVEEDGRDYLALVEEMSALSLPWLGLEVESLDSQSMATEIAEFTRILQGATYHAFAPLTLSTLHAVHEQVEQHSSVRLGMHSICSLTQLLLAARTGATDVVFDAHMLASVGMDAPQLVSEYKRAFASYHLPCTLIIRGVRHSLDVERMALALADGVICTWDVLVGLAYHPYSDVSILRKLELRTNQPT